MQNKTRLWIKNMIAAVVTGISTSALSGFGVAGADAVGLKVTALDTKQLCIVALVGGLVGLFAYLKQSPVPPEE